MGKTAKKRSVKRTKKSFVSPFNIYWKKNNYMLLLAGIVVIIAGYIFMSMGSWNSTPSLYISPILLVIGYLIIIPFSILYRGKEEEAPASEEHDVASGKS